jgi:hypothetical protein
VVAVEESSIPNERTAVAVDIRAFEREAHAPGVEDLDEHVIDVPDPTVGAPERVGFVDSRRRAAADAPECARRLTHRDALVVGGDELAAVRTGSVASDPLTRP